MKRFQLCLSLLILFPIIAFSQPKGASRHSSFEPKTRRVASEQRSVHTAYMSSGKSNTTQNLAKNWVSGGALQPTALNASTKPSKSPDIVKVGIYLKGLYNFNFLKETFDTNFWLWFVYTNPKLNPLKYTEIVNDVTTKRSFLEPVTISPGVYWAQAEYNSVIKKHWQLENFPFDTQILQIYFENVDKGIGEVIFKPDLKDSYIDKEVHEHNWKITSFTLKTATKIYKSNFGYPAAGNKFSRFVVEIKMKRIGWRRFFQYFGVLYLAMFLSFSVLLLPPESINPRVGLIAGAIFATFGNKIMIDTNLALSNRLILVDTVQLFTMIYMAFILCMALIETYLYKREFLKQRKIVNTLAIVASVIVVPLYNIVLVYRAIH